MKTFLVPTADGSSDATSGSRTTPSFNRASHMKLVSSIKL